MANGKVYIHELVEIRGANRAKYMRHMTAGFANVRRDHDQKCVGVWAEVGSTGNWPRTVNLWEHDGWESLAFHLGFESSGSKVEQSSARGSMEPEEAAWWEAAVEFRRGGRDRILVPTPWSRTVDELVHDGVKGALYIHERVWTRPNQSSAYLAALEGLGLSAYASAGAEIVGAYDNALINGRECIMLWAVPDWPTWAAFERAGTSSAAFKAFNEEVSPVVDRYERRLLTDCPLNPMVLGRQPELSDLGPSPFRHQAAPAGWLAPGEH